MTIMYNIVVRLAWLTLHLIAPFNQKVKLWLDGRKHLFEQLVSYRKKNPKPKTTIWLHAASLGEFEQGRPVIESLKQRHPTIEIILTFFSPSGYEIRKDYPHADLVTYLPPDTASNAQKFVQIIQPDIAIFVKYEFWHHHLKALHKTNTPVFLISALFRANQLFFKPWGVFFRNMLKNITYFFVQNENSAKLLNSIGIQRVTVAGDTRIDRVLAIAETVPGNTIVKSFAGDKKVLIAGSTWWEDENILARFINSQPTESWKFIIAPHEIHDSHIEKLLSLLEITTIRYTRASEKELIDAKVLIIDNIGLLNQLYQYARIAYIGGGFGKGIHNTLEPAAFGCPVIFGENYQKFEEAKELVKSKGSFVIRNYDDFVKIFEYLNEEKNYKTASSKVARFLSKNKGATEKVISKLEHIINDR